MKAGICTIALQKRTVFEAIDTARRLGAEAVEIWGKPAHTDYPVNKDALARVRDHAAQAGVSIISFGSYYNAGAAVDINGVRLTKETELSIAKALGAKFIRIWAGNKEQKDLSPEIITAIIDDIRAFGDLAGTEGRTIVLERHCNTITSGWDGIDALMKRINHPNVALNYQIPYPAALAEFETRSVADYTALLPYARQAHLQNYLRDPAIRNPKRTLLSDGAVNYTDFGTAAKQANYSGYAMIEFLPDNPSAQSADDIDGLLAKDIAFIHSL